MAPSSSESRVRHHSILIMAPNPDISAAEQQLCEITWEGHVGGHPNFFDLKWAVCEGW
jgi:hypothetical protein